jgi:acyl-CoA synthetase (NDP forming)
VNGDAFRSLRAFFNPRSVAVVGVGRNGGVGAAIFDNLRGTFQGSVYPVNPEH